MRTKAFILLFALAALAGGLWLLNAPKARPNIVFVMMDTLRADHLSAYGYLRETSPNFDRLARESLWFRRAVTTAPWTPPAVASMMTGRYASGHGMMPPNGRNLARKVSASLDRKNITLAEVLHSQGYQTFGISSNPWIKLEFGFDQGFEQYYARERARAGEMTRAAIKVMGERDREKPFFLYVHYLDPHDPYDPPGDFATKFQGPVEGKDPKLMAEINLYDGEIAYLDSELGKLFEWMKTHEVWEDTVVVLIGDHGEQFNEHGHVGHGFYLYNDEVHVPLVVRVPGAAPAVHDSVVTVADIFATVLQAAGAPIPPHDGISLLDAQALAARPGVLSEINRKYSSQSFTTTEGLRLIADFGSSENPRPDPALKLFDSVKDGFGRAPLADGQLTKEVKLDLDAVLARIAQSKIEAEEVKVDNETLRQLESLGYMK